MAKNTAGVSIVTRTPSDVAALVSEVFEEQARDIYGPGASDGYSSWGFEARDASGMFIAERFRRSGIGSRLLQIALQYGRERGEKICTLQTFDFQAPTYYQRQGFAVEFSHGGFPDTRGPQAVLYLSRAIAAADADALPAGSVPPAGACVELGASALTIRAVGGCSSAEAAEEERTLDERLEQAFQEHAAAALSGASSRNAAFCFAAMDSSGVVVGAAQGRCYWGCLSLEVLVVAKGVRGTGVGSALFQRALQHGRDTGCAMACVQTFDYQSPRFYERHGFSRDFEQPGWGHGAVNLFFRRSL